MSTTDEPQDEQADLASAERHDEAAAARDDGEQELAAAPADDDAAVPSVPDAEADPAAEAAAPVEVDSAGDDSSQPLAPSADSALVAESGEIAHDGESALPADDAGVDAEGNAELDAEEDAPSPVVDRGLIEALLFAADEPLTPAQIKKVLGGVETSEVRAVLETIRAELDERKAGFALIEVAGGFQFRTRAEYGVWIRQLRSDKPPKLSKPALETLAVVSYKQPVTRAEIEAIRRVDTGAVLKTLLDRRLLKIVGTKDVPGRPALYGTSKEFLEVFRLKSLKELPTLKEIRDVAVEMGDALDVPRELLPEEVAAALPPVEASLDAAPEQGVEPGDDEGEPDVGADDHGGQDSPVTTEEPDGSAEDEPAPSPPSAAAEED